MKKHYIFFLLLSVSFTLLAEKPITIVRDRVGGNSTNKFNLIQRDVIDSDTKTTVHIQCFDPGENSCPTAKPILNPPSIVNIEPALINVVEEIFIESDEDFNNGNSEGSGNRTVIVTSLDGSQKTYLITYFWEVLQGVEKCTINITLF
ncbi:MAG: hypothetical protein FGM41_00660 [Bacteroidetes bacterium]|nr:hypothetical protein [Bacteroidota bacterium]